MQAALEAVGLNWFQAARLALELAETDTEQRRGTPLLQYCRQVIQLGASAAARITRPSVSWKTAVASLLASRQHRRMRTQREIAIICRRLTSLLEPGTPLSALNPDRCAELLQQAYHTTRQQYKARQILHGLFNHAVQQGWCTENPVSRLTKPVLTEAEIHPLSPDELRRLLRTARRPSHRSCMPALGMMLWGGVRPTEVTRLRWEDVDWEEAVLTLRPLHSKTGGSRHVTLHPVLQTWLRDYGIQPCGPICPPCWLRRWRRLRAEAGLLPWRQDVLRHTFASYHAKHFHNFALLQMEMGHHSATLLRTRYLSMQGVTAEAARRFWKDGGL